MRIGTISPQSRSKALFRKSCPPSHSFSLKPYRTLNSVLINGLGRFQGNPTSELSVIKVQKGKRYVPWYRSGLELIGDRYRIRLVNVACDPNFIFSIDNHNVTIIEVDGVNHRPLAADSIQIFAGKCLQDMMSVDTKRRFSQVNDIPLL